MASLTLMLVSAVCKCVHLCLLPTRTRLLFPPSLSHFSCRTSAKTHNALEIFIRRDVSCQKPELTLSPHTTFMFIWTSGKITDYRPSLDVYLYSLHSHSQLHWYKHISKVNTWGNVHVNRFQAMITLQMMVQQTRFPHLYRSFSVNPGGRGIKRKLSTKEFDNVRQSSLLWGKGGKWRQVIRLSLN